MFYLKIFSKSLAYSKIASTIMFFSLVALFVTQLNIERIERLVLNQDSLLDKNPYFYAIIPETSNINYLKRKLIDLPGVKKVGLLSQKKIKEHVRTVLESTQVSFDSNLLDLNYSGLKIGISPDLKKRSLNLIRNYIKRIAGEGDVTLGAVKKPLSNEKSKKRGSIILTLVGLFPLLFLSIYFSSLALIGKNLRKECWLIEVYQRKKNIFRKCMILSQLPIILLLFSFFLLGKGPALTSLIFFILGLLSIIVFNKKGEVL